MCKTPHRLQCISQFYSKVPYEAYTVHHENLRVTMSKFPNVFNTFFREKEAWDSFDIVPDSEDNSSLEACFNFFLKVFLKIIFHFWCLFKRIPRLTPHSFWLSWQLIPFTHLLFLTLARVERGHLKWCNLKCHILLRSYVSQYFSISLFPLCLRAFGIVAQSSLWLRYV